MKTLKRISALFLTVIILALSLPSAKVTANADADMYYGRKALSKMSNGAGLVKVYDALVEGVATLQDPIYVPDDVTINENELTTIYRMFYSDYPEYFWIASGIPGYSGASEYDIFSIRPVYVTNSVGYGKFSNLETAKTEYNAKVAELTSGLDGKSDYEKAMILHDRLCETVTYTSYCDNHQNAYGALVEGEAVCNGYARAYQHLLKSVGIPAWYVSGFSRNNSHAWNLVKIDGSWYYSDATWDDMDDRSGYFENCYEYFNITTTQLLIDHTIREEYAPLVPYVTATEANYYVKENLIFSSFNKQQLVNALLRSEENVVFLKFSGGYTYQQFFSSFYEVEEDIAAVLGSAANYKLNKQIFGFFENDWIVFLDFDVTSECQHVYSNACDNTCNNCPQMRIVGDHVYTNACDSDCNECGVTRITTHSYSNNCDAICNVCSNTREVPDHIYDNDCDKNCNECGNTRAVADHVYDDECDADCNICDEPRTAPHVYDDKLDERCNKCDTRRVTKWRVGIDKTGIYSIIPNQEITDFTEDSITVSDKSGNAVEYNDKKRGWPLLKGQKYTITLNIDVENTTDLTWNITKKADTIFSDTNSTENGGWYNDAVTYSVGAGLITGYGGTDLFGTADNIQRQDFVVILARMAGVDLANYQSDRASFADVPSGAYYEKAILWAADCGITTGYNDGLNRFGVGDKITREQLVTFLYRYAKHQNGGISPEISNNAAEKAAAYPDFAGVTDYAEEAIIWALDKGVISGKGGTHIAPAGNALRCEIAQIMYNIFLNDIF